MKSIPHRSILFVSSLLLSFAILIAGFSMSYILAELGSLEDFVKENMEDFNGIVDDAWKTIMKDFDGIRIRRGIKSERKRESYDTYKQPPEDSKHPFSCSKVGQKGADGIPGPPGEPGIPGKDGIPGVSSRRNKTADCITCSMGPPGNRGEDGPSGCPGPDGKPGEDGYVEEGEPGIAGPPGLPGKDGSGGPKGEKGQPGEPGKRTKNLPGPPGTPGEMGPSGEPGKAIEKYSEQGPQGPPGPAGPPGKDGSPGEDGDPGDPGDEAEPGKDGEYCPCPKRSALSNEGYDGASSQDEAEEVEGSSAYRKRNIAIPGKIFPSADFTFPIEKRNIRAKQLRRKKKLNVPDKVLKVTKIPSYRRGRTTIRPNQILLRSDDGKRRRRQKLIFT